MLKKRVDFFTSWEFCLPCTVLFSYCVFVAMNSSNVENFEVSVIAFAGSTVKSFNTMKILLFYFISVGPCVSVSQQKVQHDVYMPDGGYTSNLLHCISIFPLSVVMSVDMKYIVLLVKNLQFHLCICST